MLCKVLFIVHLQILLCFESIQKQNRLKDLDSDCQYETTLVSVQ